MGENGTINQPQLNGKELVRDENGRVVSGVLNPNGRPPKGHSITDILRQMMNEKPEIKRALNTKLLEMALGGDLQAIREIFDRIEGKPTQTTEIGGIDGQPIPIMSAVLTKEVKDVCRDNWDEKDTSVKKED